MYFRCPTCGTSFAKRYVKWKTETMKIKKNSKLTEEEKNKKIYELLDELHLYKMCCRMRMITQSDLTELIK